MKKLSHHMPIWLLIITLLLVTLSGCGKEKSYIAPAFSMPQQFETVDSGLIAENNRFDLLWDQERACVQLREKLTQKIWSSTPYEFYQSGDSSSNIESPIYVEYEDTEEGHTRTQRAYSQVIEEGNASYRRIDNGLIMELYFQDSEIMIPVAYTLRDDGLAVSIDVKSIQEGKHKLLSISLAPYFCAVPNKGKDNYLVIPNGSGALMYATEDVGGARKYIGELYGKDATRQFVYESTEETPLNLPFFGAKNGSDALCAIIEKGTGMAFINAVAGDTVSNYSNVYAKFQMRNYDTVEATVNWNTTEMKMYADSFAANDDICVVYYPLSGEDADYLGMAKTYRNYLKQKGYLQSEKTSEAKYGVTFLGGALIEKDLFGIPYSSLMVTTDYKQAYSALSRLHEKLGTLPAVNLFGFSENGFDAGKIGGGFTLNGKYGSKSELTQLLEFVSTNNSNIFWDVDIIHFTKSGKGFSTITDKAKTANLEVGKQVTLSKALNNPLENGRTTNFLTRRKLESAFDKTLTFAKKNSLTGIGLSSFGNTVYSDYQSEEFEGRGNAETQVVTCLNKAVEEKIPVSLVSANGYAAALANIVFETPTMAGKYDAFDEEIPLYAAVFKGYIDLVSTSVNLAENPETAFLKAVEHGTIPGFTLIGKYDIALTDTSYEAFYGSLYQDNENLICSLIQKSSAYYEAIADAHIIDHKRLENGVTQTVFDNGVTVYTNPGKQDCSIPLGVLPAGEFQYTVLQKGE